MGKSHGTGHCLPCPPLLSPSQRQQLSPRARAGIRVSSQPLQELLCTTSFLLLPPKEAAEILLSPALLHLSCKNRKNPTVLAGTSVASESIFPALAGKEKYKLKSPAEPGEALRVRTGMDSPGCSTEPWNSLGGKNPPRFSCPAVPPALPKPTQTIVLICKTPSGMVTPPLPWGGLCQYLTTLSRKRSLPLTWAFSGNSWERHPTLCSAMVGIF